MRLSSCLAGAVVLLLAVPAHAHSYRSSSGAGADYAYGSGYSGDAYAPSANNRQPGFDPVARDAWLADCHDRLAYDDGPGSGECEAYLDRYYQSYTQGRYHSGSYAYAAPAKSNCVETVEYVTENVPVSPARRVIPKRTKLMPIPDKRIKLQRVK